jgi:hypothetical protein
MLLAAYLRGELSGASGQARGSATRKLRGQRGETAASRHHRLWEHCIQTCSTKGFLPYPLDLEKSEETSDLVLHTKRLTRLTPVSKKHLLRTSNQSGICKKSSRVFGDRDFSLQALLPSAAGAHVIDSPACWRTTRPYAW